MSSAASSARRFCVARMATKIMPAAVVIVQNDTAFDMQCCELIYNQGQYTAQRLDGSELTIASATIPAKTIYMFIVNAHDLTQRRRPSNEQPNVTLQYKINAPSNAKIEKCD